MKTFFTALRLFAVLAALCGVLYPLAVTAIARVAFPSQATGSVVADSAGQPVGSALLAQKTGSSRYFWPRPSAAGYATVASGASNLAPTSAKLHAAVRERAAALRAAHGLPADAPVPADLLLASGSGLDPHISPAAAEFQAARVAAARSVSVDTIRAVIAARVEAGGSLGEDRINVLLLNLDLDRP